MAELAVVGGALVLTGIGLFSLAVLPVQAAGVLLLLIAAAMFVAEMFAPSIGVAAAGGTGALVLSAIFLFRDVPGLEVSMAVVAPVAVVVGGAVVLADRLVVHSRHAPSTLTGPGRFVGRSVTVRRAGAAGDQGGQAFLAGAWWRVRTMGPPLDEGSVVRVVDVDGLDLLVEPVPDDNSPDNRRNDHE